MYKILVADDEKYDRDAIINILKNDFNDDFDVSQAKNGREAIEITEIEKPDIIIMDIKMPGIDGLKAIAEIKKFHQNAYFIILSAYDYFDFALEAMKLNVKDYILKPFSKKELIDKIQKGIEFINIERMKRKKQIEEQEKIYNLLPVLENELSYSIIINMVDLIDYQIYMDYLNMNFNNACCIIVDIKKDNNSDNIKIKVVDFLKEFIGRKYKNIVSYRFTKEIVFFISFDDKKVFSNREIMGNLTESIISEIRKVFNISVKIGNGSIYNGIHNMYKSYREACESLEYIDSDDLKLNRYEALEKQHNADSKKIILFKEVEKYIVENLKEDIDMEKTAKRFNISSSYFSRIFKDVLGYNFSDYINMIRIKKSKELLKEGILTIKEICYEVGYSDPNYFSKVFKKYEGVTPSEYKQKLI
ncbi:two-component system, response regulator YesN [Caloramator quimbayensis]|uniref:Stage 0 sporulation protein A homolog n=1 Tax=Caloramator quimbayensis TaxID=1147123 RepID=A0A1T4YB72_9CLOT|nr:response regulator [Caloramator quimbayensis]SKA98768.1 two-component system, response regulator YesN [Caloramator quimbayensis]